MLKQIRFAIKDLTHHLPLAALFVFQFTICLLYLMIVGENAQSSFKLLNIVNRMESSRITLFQTYYENTSMLSQTVVEKLSRLLDRQRSACAVVESISIPEYPGLPALVALGNIEDFVPLPKECAQGEIHVYVGAGVEQLTTGDNVNLKSLGQKNAVVAGRLPSGLTYLQRASYLIDLDQCILICIPYSLLETCYPHYYTADVLSSLYLMAADENTVDSLVEMVSDSGGLEIRPVVFYTLIREQHGKNMESAAFFLLFFACFLLFSLLGLAIGLINLLDANNTEYTVHLLYGARKRDIYFRSFWFLWFILAVPFQLAAYQVRPVAPVMGSPFLALAFSMILAAAFAGIAPGRIHESNLTSLLRRDN